MSSVNAASGATGVSQREQGRAFVQSAPPRDRNKADEIQTMPMASRQMHSTFVTHQAPSPHSGRGRIVDLFA
ncbi:MAG TPA: hypothetical protein VEB64_09925 [Azospirillaceae bacterium]|nr:hypothetical protein [Azospirillaceae bacterium]